ncbi:hypothetical protein DFJ63DRAFT_236437 [Scheffersomyces coipomensis]|uniref:uncharacterized protein n=1 Tax=Scheffersomyces coipomensis TaxID=1788519 RepID=UPI00315DDA40
MENIENIKLFIKSLDSSTAQLESSLEPILKQSLHELVARNVSNNDPIEKIKLYNDFTYTVISVLFAYIKSLGVKTDSHPIMKELGRIKQFMKRFKDLQDNVETSDTQQKEENEKAKQFLQNTLGFKNSGGQAVPNSLSSPAISASNFKGTHTKFNSQSDDDDDDVKEEDSKIEAKSSAPMKKTKSKTNNKVTKPKLSKKKNSTK